LSLETTSAKNALIVLGNTLTAKEIAAGRTAGNRLAPRMIVAPLLSESGHQEVS
jgi:hypothetical protein